MKKSFYIIIALWLVLIASFILNLSLPFVFGREILLKTVPVDPRDLLRGDYVILNYEVAQVPKDFDYKNYSPIKNVLYAVLETDENNVASLKYMTTDKPKVGLFLAGKPSRCPGWFNNSRCVRFGIESYFIKEKTGYEFENATRGNLVKVVVDKNGKARVKGLVKQ